MFLTDSNEQQFGSFKLLPSWSSKQLWAIYLSIYFAPFITTKYSHLVDCLLELQLENSIRRVCNLLLFQIDMLLVLSFPFMERKYETNSESLEQKFDIYF